MSSSPPSTVDDQPRVAQPHAAQPRAPTESALAAGWRSLVQTVTDETNALASTFSVDAVQRTWHDLTDDTARQLATLLAPSPGNGPANNAQSTSTTSIGNDMTASPPLLSRLCTLADAVVTSVESGLGRLLDDAFALVPPDPGMSEMSGMDDYMNDDSVTPSHDIPLRPLGHSPAHKQRLLDDVRYNQFTYTRDPVDVFAGDAHALERYYAFAGSRSGSSSAGVNGSASENGSFRMAAYADRMAELYAKDARLRELHQRLVPAVLRNDEFWLRYFFHVDEFLRAWEEQHAQASRRSSSDESYEMVESVARVDEVEQVQTAVSVDEGGQASTGASGSKARVPNVGGPNVDSASPATSTIV